MDVVKAMGASDLLGGLSSRSLAMVASGHRVRALSRGQHLFVEGDDGAAVYLLVSGTIRLYKSDANGNEVVVHIVRAGEVFAEAVLFDRDEYPVSAEAREACRVAEIDVRRVRGLLDDQEFRTDFLANVMRKLRYLAGQVYVLSSCDVRERLVRFLVGRFGRRRVYEVDLPKKDVAAAIYTTPETLSRVLADFERDELLRWSKNRVEVSERLWVWLEEDNNQPPQT